MQLSKPAHQSKASLKDICAKENQITGQNNDADHLLRGMHCFEENYDRIKLANMTAGVQVNGGSCGVIHLSAAHKCNQRGNIFGGGESVER